MNGNRNGPSYHSGGFEVRAAAPSLLQMYGLILSSLIGLTEDSQAEI